MICVPLHYAPVQYFFQQIRKEKEICVPLDQPFRKMGFQNRMIIPTANGLINLSIPVRGGREVRSTMAHVMIDNSQRWQVQHWRTLTAAYRRSPWFEFYEASISSIYSGVYERLADWNMAMLEWILASLHYQINLVVVESAAQGHRLHDQLAMLRPANASSAMFVRDLPAYNQVFMDRIGFQENVSILDLLFNEGNQSKGLLESSLPAY